MSSVEGEAFFAMDPPREAAWSWEYLQTLWDTPNRMQDVVSSMDGRGFMQPVKGARMRLWSRDDHGMWSEPVLVDVATRVGGQACAISRVSPGGHLALWASERFAAEHQACLAMVRGGEQFVEEDRLWRVKSPAGIYRVINHAISDNAAAIAFTQVAVTSDFVTGPPQLRFYDRAATGWRASGVFDLPMNPSPFSLVFGDGYLAVVHGDRAGPVLEIYQRSADGWHRTQKTSPELWELDGRLVESEGRLHVRARSKDLGSCVLVYERDDVTGQFHETAEVRALLEETSIYGLAACGPNLFLGYPDAPGLDDEQCAGAVHSFEWNGQSYIEHLDALRAPAEETNARFGTQLYSASPVDLLVFTNAGPLHAFRGRAHAPGLRSPFGVRELPPPVTMEPSGMATIHGHNVWLVWQPVEGATRYLIEEGGPTRHCGNMIQHNRLVVPRPAETVTSMGLCYYPVRSRLLYDCHGRPFSDVWWRVTAGDHLGWGVRGNLVAFRAP